LKLINGEISSF